MRVFCYPVSPNSAYLPLIFDGTADRYRPVTRDEGDLADAIRAADGGERILVHVHWEEFVLDGCASAAEAGAAAVAFVREIGELRERSVPLVWTIHNEWPHVSPYREAFLVMRAALAARASVVLAHDDASIGVLAAQVALDTAKVRLLPHPSYLGRHEDEAALLAGLDEPHERCVQGFGWIRRQKGFGELIDALPAAYLRERDAFVRISGSGEEAAAVMARHADRPDVVWDVRHVPDAEVPALLRSAACVVLPYERVLTSGVALLAMSAGVPLVAVDVPQLRELLPAENHRFLYPRGDRDALRLVVDGVLGLTPDERRRVVEANLAVARDVRPRAIAARLARIYDELAA